MNIEGQEEKDTFFNFVIPYREQEHKYSSFANLVNIFRDKFPRSADFETHNRFVQNSPAFISYYKLFKEIWGMYKNKERNDHPHESNGYS